MKKAIIYTRAKVNLSECNFFSISTQVTLCKEYAKKNGMEIVGFYSDIFAVDTERKCVEWEAITQIQKPNFDFVIVDSFKRISRESSQLLKARNDLKKHGVKILSVTTPLPNEIENMFWKMKKLTLRSNKKCLNQMNKNNK